MKHLSNHLSKLALLVIAIMLTQLAMLVTMTTSAFNKQQKDTESSTFQRK